MNQDQEMNQTREYNNYLTDWKEMDKDQEMNPNIVSCLYNSQVWRF